MAPARVGPTVIPQTKSLTSIQPTYLLASNALQDGHMSNRSLAMGDTRPASKTMRWSPRNLPAGGIGLPDGVTLSIGHDHVPIALEGYSMRAIVAAPGVSGKNRILP